MSEFLLYKKRNFSAYVSDSIQFVKLYGKNYFKNFIIINGALLLVLCILYYFTMKDMLGSMGNPKAMELWVQNQTNIVVMVILFFLLFIVSVVYSVSSIGQPLIYVKLLEKTDRTEFTSSEILKGIFGIVGRILLFGLISMFIFVPILIVFILLGAALSLLLIGIPLLLIGIPAVMVWVTQSLLVYVYENDGYFDSLKKGWKILFSNFWHIVGSSLIIYIIISVIQGIFNMIPYFIMLGSLLGAGANPENFTLPPVTIFLYIVGIIVAFILYNIFYIQQCLVYYSAAEDLDHFQAISEIDTIGNNEE